MPMVEGALADSEEAVMHTFDFLSGEQVVDEDDEEENLRLVCAFGILHCIV